MRLSELVEQAGEAEGDAELELALGDRVAELGFGAADAVGDGVGVDAEAAGGADEAAALLEEDRQGRSEADGGVVGGGERAKLAAAKRRAASGFSSSSASSERSVKLARTRPASPRSWATRRACSASR